jgi:co-chaperonin GroES (HSP10)
MIPLKDRVIIKLKEIPEKTQSGLLFLPQGANQLSFCVGTVDSVGHGEWLEKAGRYESPKVSVGDEVLFSPLAGEYLDDKRMVLSVTECNILAVIEPGTSVTSWNKYKVHPRSVE